VAAFRILLSQDARKFLAQIRARWDKALFADWRAVANGIVVLPAAEIPLALSVPITMAAKCCACGEFSHSLASGHSGPRHH